MLEFINTEGNTALQPRPKWKIYKIKGPAWYQNHISTNKVLYNLLHFILTYLFKNILVMSSVNLLKNNLISQKDQ